MAAYRLATANPLKREIAGACPRASSLLVAPVHLRRRCCCFDGGEGVDDAVGVFGMRRHEPGIAGHKRDGLTFEGKFGLSRDDVTDRLIVPAAGPVRLWRLVFPQSHREM